MLTQGSITYLVVATGCGERRLIPGTVVETAGDRCRITFESLGDQIATGGDINFLYERNSRLYQRGAHVLEREAPLLTTAAETSHTLSVEFIGQEVSADSRGCFRVSTAVMDLTARFENDRSCRVLDISAEGIAIIVPTSLRIGTMGRLRFEHEGIAVDTRARVQSMRPRAGDFRCGLLIPSTEKAQRSSLQQLTALLQRAQLQRLRMSA